MRYFQPRPLSYDHCIYCIVFIHFYSASHSMSLSEALPSTEIDTVSEFTRRSATGNCKWRTCPRFLRGDLSGIRTHDPPVERHLLYQCATTSLNIIYGELRGRPVVLIHLQAVGKPTGNVFEDGFHYFSSMCGKGAQQVLFNHSGRRD